MRISDWSSDVCSSDLLNVDASWSHARRTDFLLETQTGSGFMKSGPGDTVTVTQKGNGTYTSVPTLDYTDTDIFTLTDPPGWGNKGTQQVAQAGFLNRPSFKDARNGLTARLNGELDVTAGRERGWQ